MKVDYYEVLGVGRGATEEEIRDRFRKLARDSHPDRFKGALKAEAETRFQTLTEAVNVLTNATRRKLHDAEIFTGTSKTTADLGQVAKVYLQKGVKAFQEGDISAAYDNFDMAVKHNPQEAKAHYYLARAASRIPSRARQAVQAIEAAVQREPMNPQYLKDAGLMCKKAGLAAKAERYLEEALKWDRENVEIQGALAELRQGRSETKDAGKGFGIFRKN